MKRKFLEDLGLEKEAVDKIMAENGADIEALKKGSGDIETLQKQISELQAANSEAQERHEAEIKELKLSAAIKLAVGEAAQDAELVAGLFDRSKLALSEDGKIDGLEEQLKNLRKEKAFLFKEEKASQPQIKGGKPAEGSKLLSARKPSEMTYSEMCAYLEANSEATIN